MFISMTAFVFRRAPLVSRKYMARIRHAAVACMFAMCLTGIAAQAQQPNSRATITPNYKDADLAQITEAVAAVTGKTFIIDPRVKAQVTMLSSTPMSPQAFYEAYLSILQVHGYIAVPSGNLIKIVPEQNTRTSPANDLPNSVSSSSDELVTQIIAVHNVSASQLVPFLRPLIGQNGQLAAYAASNMLIITDHANNVNRLMRIIERIDRASDDEIEVIQMQNATAAEIVKVVNSLNSGAAAQQVEGGQTVKIVSDDRTNSILISGDKSARLRIKTLIAYLDTPLQSGGNTQVRYLHYADAEDMAKKLKEQVQSITQATTASAAPGGAPVSSSGSGSSASIWADKGTNALIITAPPKVMQQIMAIVDKLDIRRMQVHVEAIVAEVNMNKSAELGVNWALYGKGDTNVPAAVFNGGSTPISGMLSSALGGGVPNIPSGTTLGVGRLVDSGVSFAAILRALRSDGGSNIVSTPSVVMLDNEEATINVSQEVPFLTGQYSGTGLSGSNTGGAANSFVNPFQTIQRQDVGTKLKITPKINGSDSLILTIDQDASSLSDATGDAGSKIVNKREIKTKVMVEDGGIIVIGGLLGDSLSGGEDRVPVLGSIPIIGNLFRARHTTKTKQNLMVFIKPTILGDETQTAIETNAKYNFMRNLQLDQNSGKVPLQPDEHQPLLPPLETPPIDLRRPSAKQPLNESNADKPLAPPATTDDAASAPAKQ